MHVSWKGDAVIHTHVRGTIGNYWPEYQNQAPYRHYTAWSYCAVRKKEIGLRVYCAVRGGFV